MKTLLIRHNGSELEITPPYNIDFDNTTRIRINGVEIAEIYLTPDQLVILINCLDKILLSVMQNTTND